MGSEDTIQDMWQLQGLCVIEGIIYSVIPTLEAFLSIRKHSCILLTHSSSVVPLEAVLAPAVRTPHGHMADHTTQVAHLVPLCREYHTVQCHTMRGSLP